MSQHFSEKAMQRAPNAIELPRTNNPAFDRTMQDITDLNLTDNLMELDVIGYTRLRGVLNEDQVNRAKDAIARVMEEKTGNAVDIENESGSHWEGMSLAHYLLFADSVFEEIVQSSRPLALIHYLLGRRAVLSSMTCHFKAQGGRPLALHSDNGNGMPSPFSMISQVANVNYALTEYSKERGALAMVPGSHRLCRSPREDEMGLGAKNLNPQAVSIDLDPGDCVVWHGNTWHGSFRRNQPGIRINLATYFCRQYIVTQEKFGEHVPEEFLRRHANNPQMLTLLNQQQSYGWDASGPDWSKFGSQPRTQFD